MNEFKRYEVEGLRFEFSPNGTPLTGILATAEEQSGPYVAELNLAQPRGRKSYAKAAGEVCGIDAGRLERALNELCALRLAEVEQAREAAGEHGKPEAREEQDAPDGAELLEELAGFIRRYVALSEDQALLIALWIVHTHALAAADTTPYLNIKSVEKRSGKTRLLEVLALLVARPWLTGRVSAAVLVRKTAGEQPTLLLDESDAAFKGDKEYAEALRGILNAGFRRGGVASLCVGQGASITYEDFPVFGPKAIAGIGKLPDTVADRAIPIELRRRRPNEKVERFRLRKVEPPALPLREAASAWAEAHLAVLSEAEPDLPDELDDRAQDIMEPLLAIADEVGGEWPERARKAAVALLASGQREDSESLGVRLLRDIRSVFDKKDADRLATGTILEKLCDAEEAPWGSLRGEPLDARGLARLLKPYGIRPEKLRGGANTFRGYQRASFEDAWARYAPDTPEEAEQAEHPEHPADRAGSEVPHKQNVPEHAPDAEHEDPHRKGDVPHVPDVPDNPGTGEGELPLSADLRPGESATLEELRARRERALTLREALAEINRPGSGAAKNAELYRRGELPEERAVEYVTCAILARLGNVYGVTGRVSEGFRDFITTIQNLWDKLPDGLKQAAGTIVDQLAGPFDEAAQKVVRGSILPDMLDDIERRWRDTPGRLSRHSAGIEEAVVGPWRRAAEAQRALRADLERTPRPHRGGEGSGAWHSPGGLEGARLLHAAPVTTRRATSADSPGGAAITPAEMRQIMREAIGEGNRAQAVMIRASIAGIGDPKVLQLFDDLMGSYFEFRNDMGSNAR